MVGPAVGTQCWQRSVVHHMNSRLVIVVGPYCILWRRWTLQTISIGIEMSRQWYWPVRVIRLVWLSQWQTTWITMSKLWMVTALSTDGHYFRVSKSWWRIWLSWLQNSALEKLKWRLLASQVSVNRAIQVHTYILATKKGLSSVTVMFVVGWWRPQD